MRLQTVLPLVGLMFCALTVGARAADFKLDRIGDTIVRFEGTIDAASADALLLAFDDRVTTLRVNSPGGDMWSGVRIGNYVHDHRLTVEVEDLCASTCANYIFLGAVKKRLFPGAILGFHGNMLPNLSEEKLAALRAQGEPSTPTGKDFRDTLEAAWRAELAFLDRIAMRPDFFNHVSEKNNERWKTLGRQHKEPVVEIVVATDTEVKRFSKDQQQAVSDFVLKLTNERVNFKLSAAISTGSDYSDMIYFPRRATLERYGIAGISDYPYPDSEAELKGMKMFKKLPDAIVIAEF